VRGHGILLIGGGLISILHCLIAVVISSVDVDIFGTL